jgi:magnesium transporter
MARGGHVVPVDQGSVVLGSLGKKKSLTVARSWMLMGGTGEGTVLDVDKYAIMHRVHIHARDLRILDPLLSYPSAILGRDKAIVLNLEVFPLSSDFFSFRFGFDFLTFYAF